MIVPIQGSLSGGDEKLIWARLGVLFTPTWTSWALFWMLFEDWRHPGFFTPSCLHVASQGSRGGRELKVHGAFLGGMGVTLGILATHNFIIWVPHVRSLEEPHMSLRSLRRGHLKATLGQ